MRHFGLIGFPLSHSFSKKYFSEKFANEGIKECQYELYPIEDAGSFLELFAHDQELLGLNVTIPHKQAVIPFLDRLDPLSAARIGAVNVIKREKDGSLSGYNSDYYGFKNALVKFLGVNIHEVESALILGKGGAALAVQAALTDLNIKFTYVSRTKQGDGYTYDELNAQIITEHKLIVNTTPLGMYPQLEQCANIPYQYLGSSHFVYDLVYNPEITQFMKNAQNAGANTSNGLEMLILQAEKAWEIWNMD